MPQLRVLAMPVFQWMNDKQQSTMQLDIKIPQLLAARHIDTIPSLKYLFEGHDHNPGT